MSGVKNNPVSINSSWSGAVRQCRVVSLLVVVAAVREAVWLQREERARQHQERLLAERQRKLTEQRLREEKRRAAVEEKRKRRLEEEKERHEAVVQRTLERSQRAASQKASCWSWRRALPGGSGASAPCCSVVAVSVKSMQRVAIAGLDSAKCKKTASRPMVPKTDKQANGKKINSWSSVPIISITATMSSHASAEPQRRVTAPPSERSEQGVKMQAESRGKGQGKVRVVGPSPEPPVPPIEWTATAQLFESSAQTVASTATPPASLSPSRPRAGTTDPEEAARLLADRRRLAREQREREKEECRRREESERCVREEMAQRMAEDRVQQEADARHLAEERRKTEEEEEKRVKEERNQKLREEEEQLRKKLEQSAQLELCKAKLELSASEERHLLAVMKLREEHHMDSLGVLGIMAGEMEKEKASHGDEMRRVESHNLALKEQVRALTQMREDEQRQCLKMQEMNVELQQRQTEQEKLLAQRDDVSSQLQEVNRANSRLLEQLTELGQEKDKLQQELEETRKTADKHKAMLDELAIDVAQEKSRHKEELSDAWLQHEKEREEEEAHQRQEEERLRLERERHFRKEESERSERKKRLEEIMKRTRKSDPAEKGPIPYRNEEWTLQKPELPAEPKVFSVKVTQVRPQEAQGDVCNSSNNPSPTPSPAGQWTSPKDTQLVANRISVRDDAYEVISLPKLDMKAEEDVISVVSFGRRPGALRSRPSNGDITSSQTAEVS
ncbi:hypothetical protein AAFF_G00411600 [Aldrovandia affinis]|uniref:Uncharacterized protein n=1 Tax=Aldrovandia affinis TaxID=143900 RepID=A0AAD7WJT5_9TELE|nr:hypothetical protein AAFF_G00411600 [Aldrovandia affinis]